MNCAELQQLLPDIVDGLRTPEQARHLQTCAECSSLVSDLQIISREARELRSFEEPSPRVWNSIEIALRQEGLIHEPHPTVDLAASAARRWRVAWLAPVAAALALTFGVLRYERIQSLPAVAQAPAPVRVLTSSTPVEISDDTGLLSEVGRSSPERRTAYENDLNSINAYIRDAEKMARDNPNDEEIQDHLMNAYQQKAMVYQLAMDRSLP